MARQSTHSTETTIERTSEHIEPAEARRERDLLTDRQKEVLLWIAEGKTAFGSAKNADQLSAVIRNTFIQGTLSIVFALVVIVVVGAAIVVAARAIRGTGRPPAEEDAVPSRIFAPSGLIATPAEKEVQKLWDALPPSPGKSVGTSAH